AVSGRRGRDDDRRLDSRGRELRRGGGGRGGGRRLADRPERRNGSVAREARVARDREGRNVDAGGMPAVPERRARREAGQPRLSWARTGQLSSLVSLTSHGGAPAPRRAAARLSCIARLARRGPSPATCCGSHYGAMWDSPGGGRRARRAPAGRGWISRSIRRSPVP